MKDTIIEELRRIRDEHAAHFKFDFDAIARDWLHRERADARKTARPKPRKPAKR